MRKQVLALLKWSLDCTTPTFSSPRSPPFSPPSSSTSALIATHPSALIATHPSYPDDFFDILSSRYARKYQKDELYALAVSRSLPSTHFSGDSGHWLIFSHWIDGLGHATMLMINQPTNMIVAYDHGYNYLVKRYLLPVWYAGATIREQRHLLVSTFNPDLFNIKLEEFVQCLSERKSTFYPLSQTQFTQITQLMALETPYYTIWGRNCRLYLLTVIMKLHQQAIVSCLDGYAMLVRRGLAAVPLPN